MLVDLVRTQVSFLYFLPATESQSIQWWVYSIFQPPIFQHDRQAAGGHPLSIKGKGDVGAKRNNA
jgi:hypothetical protein